MTETNATRAAGSSEPACSVGFRLNTLPHIDGKITQELQQYMGEQTRTLSRWVIDSREKGVHDTLVQLGWTPPNNAGQGAAKPYPAPACSASEFTYASKQATACAVCGERKHTPLRNDAMGGYVCLTCIDRELVRLQSQNAGIERPMKPQKEV